MADEQPSSGVVIPFTITTELQRTIDTLRITASTLFAAGDTLHDDSPYREWLNSFVDLIDTEIDLLEQRED